MGGSGTAEVSDGNLNLTGGLDSQGIYTTSVRIDETIDPDVEIYPTSALIAIRLKFTTIATVPPADSIFDYFSVLVQFR